MESIALAEASIAHILNAEGEKLQKVIADDCKFPDLLKVNESVQKTIIHATHLEQVLTSKLENLLQNSPHCCRCQNPCKEQETEDEIFDCKPNPCCEEPCFDCKPDPCCKEPCYNCKPDPCCKEPCFDCKPNPCYKEPRMDDYTK